MLVQVLATQIVIGAFKFSQVPESLRPQVADVLIGMGMGDLIDVEEYKPQQ